MNGVESIDEKLFDAFARRTIATDALVTALIVIDGCTSEIERLLDEKLDLASS